MMTDTDTDPEEPLIDVPDDFDLHDAKHASTTTPTEEQPRCPACGRVSINPRTSSINTGPNAPTERDRRDYWCRECSHAFDAEDAVYAESHADAREIIGGDDAD